MGSIPRTLGGQKPKVTSKDKIENYLEIEKAYYADERFNENSVRPKIVESSYWSDRGIIFDGH